MVSDFQARLSSVAWLDELGASQAPSDGRPTQAVFCVRFSAPYAGYWPFFSDSQLVLLGHQRVVRRHGSLSILLLAPSPAFCGLTDGRSDKQYRYRYVLANPQILQLHAELQNLRLASSCGFEEQPNAD